MDRGKKVPLYVSFLFSWVQTREVALMESNLLQGEVQSSSTP